MGQKINPFSFRLLNGNYWNSVWFETGQKYSDILVEDLTIRKYLSDKYSSSRISSVIIERSGSKVDVLIKAAKSGILIGKSGAGVDKLKASLSKITNSTLSVKITETKNPDTDASIVAQDIAKKLENRDSFRKAMRRSLRMAMRSGAKGIKIMCSGRLGGAEIARTEHSMEGSIPLHTIRAKIDYAIASAQTTYGTIGVKVWINHGFRTSLD